MDIEKLVLSSLIVVMSWVDIMLTREGITRGHPELNPLARWVTMTTLYRVRMAVAAFLAVTGYFVASAKGLALIGLMFSLVCVWNFYVLFIHRRRKRNV